MSHPKTICVDFDGVLHSYTSPFTTADEIPDPPVPGAIEWLNMRARSECYTIAIYSTRSSTAFGLDAMRRYLRKHGAETWKFELPVEKPIAYLTIDDRAFCFQGTFPPPRRNRSLYALESA